MPTKTRPSFAIILALLPIIDQSGCLSPVPYYFPYIITNTLLNLVPVHHQIIQELIYDLIIYSIKYNIHQYGSQRVMFFMMRLRNLYLYDGDRPLKSRIQECGQLLKCILINNYMQYNHICTDSIAIFRNYPSKID